MPAFGPISRRRLIQFLHDLGFTGPYPGKRHAFMARGDLRVRIPDPHSDDILDQAGIGREQWEAL